MIEGFLLGVISLSSLIAGLFFLKFWRSTHDELFRTFSFSFFIEGLNRAVLLFVQHPNEGNPGVYLVRLLAFLLILIAIVRKNVSFR